MPAIPLRWSECRQAPLFLMVVVLLAPVMAFPHTDNWRGVKPFMIQAIAFCSLALLLSRARWSVEGLRRFLTTGPNLALMLLVGWAALSFALTAPSGGRGRGIALVEMLRLASGAAIYFAVAYRCNSRDSLKLAVILLLGGGWLASVAGMVSAGVQEFHFETAAFGNSQLLAAFMVLLLPAPVIFAQRGKLTDARRLFAMGVTVMVVAALFLTHNRSSWLGSVAGLLVIAALMFKSRARGEERKPQRRWVALAIIALASVPFFFTLLGKDSMVINRVSTFAFTSRDKSFQWRLGMWSIGEQIIRDHPIKGTGIGSFALVANDYATRVPSAALIAPSEPRNVVTVDGKSYSADVPSAEQVKTEGASMSSLPHNEYLQLTAELGLVGLALYLAVLTGFFYHSVRALPRISKISRTRKLLLIAATGAIAAQCVDAFGNPGWRFGEVSPLFWIMLGLGVAATRKHSASKKAPEAESQARVRRPLRYAFARPATLMALVFALAVPAFAYIPIPCFVYVDDYRIIILPCPPPCRRACEINTTELGGPGIAVEAFAPTSGTTTKLNETVPLIVNASDTDVEDQSCHCSGVPEHKAINIVDSVNYNWRLLLGGGTLDAGGPGTLYKPPAIPIGGTDFARILVEIKDSRGNDKPAQVWFSVTIERKKNGEYKHDAGIQSQTDPGSNYAFVGADEC